MYANKNQLNNLFMHTHKQNKRVAEQRNMFSGGIIDPYLRHIISCMVFLYNKLVTRTCSELLLNDRLSIRPHFMEGATYCIRLSIKQRDSLCPDTYVEGMMKSCIQLVVKVSFYHIQTP